MGGASTRSSPRTSQDELDRAVDLGLPLLPLHLDDSLTRRAYRDSEIGSFITLATYYRLFLPRLLQDRYDRLLYVDLDIYFHRPDFVALLDLNMGGHAIAAVRDTLVHYDDDVARREFDRTISPGHRRYFNSGLMLIDVAAYEEMKIEERTIELALGGGTLMFRDQSALNMVLDGNWLELSPAFNAVVEYLTSFVREVCPPVVAHFAGRLKPWSGPRFTLAHPARREIEAFVATSQWKGFLSQFYDAKDCHLRARRRPESLAEALVLAAIRPARKPSGKKHRRLSGIDAIRRCCPGYHHASSRSAAGNPRTHGISPDRDSRRLADIGRRSRPAIPGPGRAAVLPGR